MPSGFRKKAIPGGNSGIASLPRAISKLGITSRSIAEGLIKQGLVKVNGRVITSTQFRVDIKKDKIEVESFTGKAEEKIYLMLNKPRGLVTTLSDEKGRDTVFTCFEGKNLPYIFPVGRLDKASEGLLLFTNDTAWGNKITEPESRIEKTYHVQVNAPAEKIDLNRIAKGIKIDDELFTVKKIAHLRGGEKNCWLEIILDEGKNRHIRKIFEALNIKVVRLIRISIGSIKLGYLPKGGYRLLTAGETGSLT